jgi:hypothetical protein
MQMLQEAGAETARGRPQTLTPNHATVETKSQATLWTVRFISEMIEPSNATRENDPVTIGAF